MKRKVLLIANTCWYLQNFRSQLVSRLEAEGYAVILAAPPDEFARSMFFRARPFFSLPLSRKGLNPIGELFALVRAIRLLKRIRPDVVLTWTVKPNVYGALAGMMLHIPVIPNVSGLGVVFIRDGRLARLIGILYHFAFARCPIVFFQNEEDREKFVTAGWVRAEKAERLPGSGVDLNRFWPQPLPSSQPFTFLYIGRLLADKGLRELKAAAGQLRAQGYRIVIRIAGFIDNGNPAAIQQHELIRWVAEGDVEYIGPLADVRPAIAAAHCVVLPSYYREGVPRSLLEAAATGRPIITTDAPGCRDTVVPGRSGFLCEARNVASLAACMKRVLDLPLDSLAAAGKAGRVHVEKHFSEEIVLDAYLRECEILFNPPEMATVAMDTRV